MIHIGSVARYPSGMESAELWRISPDGEARDSERKLTKVFQMEEVDFFRFYIKHNAGKMTPESQDFYMADTDNGYAKLWQKEYDEVICHVPELPFSNSWIAQNTISYLPDNCVLHLAGSNTARAWNFFRLSKTIECYSNDGTMGIDGQISALIGETLAAPTKLHIGVVGDLTFFYDMNSLGNRCVGKNLRLLVINNGMGTEFCMYSHLAAVFEEKKKEYIAAAGHFGNKSTKLIRHYAEDLGYEYLCASGKEEFKNAMRQFIVPELTEKPMVFEVFTESKDESDAVFALDHMMQRPGDMVKRRIEEGLRSVISRKRLER